MSYLFVFRADPDIDHMIPAVWKLLEAGEAVHGVVSPGYNPEGDHRLEFVSKYENFHLHEVWPTGGGRVGGSFRSFILWPIGVLVRHRVRLVAVEWGFGFDEGYDRPLSLRGARAFARSAARSLRLAASPDRHQTRVNFLVAARLLGRRTACLPHGLNIKLDPATNLELQQKLAEDSLDWSDRNRFDVYVLNTEHHRRFHLDRAHGAPDVMQTWGSLRWSPEWFAISHRLAPGYSWPAGGADRVKVVMMVPKWKNRVHASSVVDLVRRLQDLPFISLAIKGHPRPEFGGSDPLHAEPTIAWDRIEDVSPIDSVSLIAAADVVLDVGSSIGLEVVMQGKVLINPTYIHEPKTLFDDIAGSCVVAHDVDDVVAALEATADGRPPVADPSAVNELLRRAVYGDCEQSFDVPAYYAERLRALANQENPNSTHRSAA